MALNNTQTNFGYDHPSYLARGTWNATMPLALVAR